MKLPPWPQPPYVGDAWEYGVFESVPDGWALVNPIEEGGVFAKRQVSFAPKREPQPRWSWTKRSINGHIVTRFEVWE